LFIFENVKLGSKYIKRRHFPFPVRAGLTFKSELTQALETTQFLLQGGKNFEIKVAKTESMSTKEAVKNVFCAIRTLLALVIYAGKTKHNTIHEAYLSTTKSMPIPIVENESDEN
jgi:hypothetical protein